MTDKGKKNSGIDSLEEWERDEILKVNVLLTILMLDRQEVKGKAHQIALPFVWTNRSEWFKLKP